tara:strand:+ start:182 stop:649 length:468 start_codon:yes stop_codon:yes gene_type:complete
MSLDQNPVVLELGCGSGCVLISILAKESHVTGVGVDIDDECVETAIRNAAKHGVGNRAVFCQGSWMQGAVAALGQLQNSPACAFNMVISNPPYIRSGDIPELSRDVQNYEPHSALDGILHLELIFYSFKILILFLCIPGPYFLIDFLKIFTNYFI